MTLPCDAKWGLTADRLRSVVRYEPTTGQWTWLITLAARRMAGTIAGELKPSGYILIGIDSHRYRAHRLAWLYMTGEWPNGQVDHIDGDRSNNKWSNLRIASNKENQANARLQKNNRSGFKGVWWNKQKQRWQATIHPDRKRVHLGFFDTPQAAHAAYVAAAKKHFGEFARAA